MSSESSRPLKPKVKRIKLIITARDPATAYSFDKIIVEFSNHPLFDLLVLTQRPAAEILLSVHPEAIVLTDTNEDDLKNSVVSYLMDWQPDAVLTGISGPDVGIDEITLLCAQELRVKSYALQNFWGDINQATNALPEVAFVLDDEAIKLTQQRYPKIECVAIGSIKHADFIKYDSLSIREQSRKNLGIDSKIVIGFYGQPLEGIKGYFATVLAMTEALKNWNKPFVLIYRPHPKESPSLQNKTKSLFEKNLTNQFLMDSSDRIVESLVSADIVVSAFSTCGFDNLYLNEMANQPFNSSVYLWFNEHLIQWWHDYSGLTEMPLIDEGLLLSPDSEETILETFERAICPNTQKALRHQAKLHLPNPSQAIDKVVHRLLEDLL